MAAVTARTAMLVVALVAIVISAIWLSDAQRFTGAETAAARSKTPAQLLAAAGRFRGQSALTPDTDAKAGRAFALLRAGRPAQAEALLEDVLRREPRNVRAWVGLYFADRGRKPARSAYAQSRIRALSPPVRP
jgi:Tfp pilus assembly protein PilF